MKARSRRAVPLALVAALAVLLLPSSASAQPAESATLTMVSDPGDYIGQGQNWSYATAAGDALTTSTDGNHVGVALTGSNGDWWYLDFEAPIDHTLTAGTTYANATRYPFNDGGPGLSVDGMGRGCNQLTGTFTVTEAAFAGPSSSHLERFAVTFEQHCEGAAPALRGELRIVNSPGPQPLELGIDVAQDGTFSRVNGRATVQGTVTCSEPVVVPVNGTLTQVKRRTIITGPIIAQVPCTPEAPVPWQAVVTPAGTTPFQRGNAEVQVTATAYDFVFGQTVTASETQVVRLRRA
jgi:hypothetical protein